jgi:hypothetical protein
VCVQIKEAMAMHERIVGTPFKFMHCWLILRHEMKWNALLDSMNPTDAKETEQKGTNIMEELLPPKIARPTGRDHDKNMKSNISSSSFTACINVLQKLSMEHGAFEERQDATSREEATHMVVRSDRKLALQEEVIIIQKASLEIQQQMLKLQEEEREERVMTMDVNKMEPWVREYYINKQKKIASSSMNVETSSAREPS